MNDGGPAFPQTADSWPCSDDGGLVPSGMSLRDWFAGKALDRVLNAALTSPNFVENSEGIGTMCYIIADTMLAAGCASPEKEDKV